MSLKKKILTGVCSAFAVVALGTFTMAQETPNTQQDNVQKSERKMGKFGKRGFGKRGGKMGMHGLRALNLTDAQKEQIRALRQAKRSEFNQSQRDEMRSIMEAKRSGTITAEQEARLKAFKEERRAEAMKMHEQIMAILTPEQKVQLEQMKLERQKRREEFRQKRQNQKPVEQPQDN